MVEKEKISKEQVEEVDSNGSMDESLICRFYRNAYPEENDLVVV
jgi:translation initiation factor 2 subunit 1